MLAAGAGTRFAAGADAAHKLLAPLGPTTVVGAALNSALEAAIGEVWVVTGAADVASQLPPGVRRLHNARWEAGQATSLQAAVSTARAEGLGALVVGLGDQPFVLPSAWRAVAGSPRPIAVATYSGRRGHPVRLAAEVWELLPMGGDRGARDVMSARPGLVEEVPCEGDPADIDTREDLTRWS